MKKQEKPTLLKESRKTAPRNSGAHIYTVSELTRGIKSVLQSSFGAVWVEGEISNFIAHQSGHMYFSIKDAGSVLACAMFRGANAKLKFKIENGMQVVCSGKISIYDKRGQYQLLVDRVEPKGKGALQVALEQLKEKLNKEGLFDKSHKKPIPYLPYRVGVITSPTGAAIRDILNVSRRRFSNIEIILNPVKVQGESAKSEIAEAIRLFNELNNIDVMIVGRGGGSLEDLWAFNEENVARAVYASKIPIISAVGHEIDWSICDFVADFRAATPSAAAELIIPRKEDLISKLKTYLDRMRASLGFLVQHEQDIDYLLEQLILKEGYVIKLKDESLKTLAGKLGALSPLGILKRGYSITLKDQAVIKDAGKLKKDDIIKTKLAKGEVVSKVEDASYGGDEI